MKISLTICNGDMTHENRFALGESIHNESLRGKVDYRKSNIFLNCDKSFGNDHPEIILDFDLERCENKDEVINALELTFEKIINNLKGDIKNENVNGNN